MSRALMVLLGGLVLSSCQGCHPQPAPNPPPGPLPSIDGSVDPTCASVCARGRAMACAWAQPTANGVPCEVVCENLTTGGPIQIDLACRARAVSQSCSAVDSCP
jgi:hypothetical protein